eukprot:4182492-Alexandrium_andersonii.AAC.1
MCSRSPALAGGGEATSTCYQANTCREAPGPRAVSETYQKESRTGNSEKEAREQSPLVPDGSLFCWAD